MIALVTILYILFFWLVLPASIIAASAELDALWSLPRLAGTRGIGFLIGAVAGFLLILSVIQFTRQSGVLPVSAYPPRKLIRRGLFAVWRHPIYLFYTVLLFAAALVQGSRAMLFAVMPAFTAAVAVYIFLEEKALQRRFGPDYLAYREQTGIVLPRFHVFLKFPFFILSKIYFPINVKNRHNIPERAPFFLVANHRNYLDPFLIAYTLPYKIHYITTYEMFRKKIRAWFFRSLGCIPKRRYSPDDGSVREIIRALKKGSVIGIFPEGERSYTGELQEFKPEPMKLFMKYRDVPVVPVSVSGNFLLWPRWGKGWRRTGITITCREPIMAKPDEPAVGLAERIRDAIRPDDTGLKCRHERRAHDIQQILYRCPECRQFGGLQPDGNDIKCAKCGAGFHLSDDYRIGGSTIHEFYERVRITPADITRPNPDGVIARSGPCDFFKEKGRDLEGLFSGTALLYADRLVLRGEGENPREVILRLLDLRSATIEGVNRLQCFDGERGEMYRIELRGDPAREWQDWISAACAALGNSPILR